MAVGAAETAEAAGGIQAGGQVTCCYALSGSGIEGGLRARMSEGPSETDVAADSGLLQPWPPLAQPTTGTVDRRPD
jgi:hypothetical protein